MSIGSLYHNIQLFGVLLQFLKHAIILWVELKINNQYPPFSTKICLDIHPRTLLFFTILFQEEYSTLRTKLEENCELWRKDNVKGQIREHIFEVKWRPLCSLSFRYFGKHAVSLKIGECHPNNSQFSLEQIQSHDEFRPIVCRQKYLMDFNSHCS